MLGSRPMRLDGVIIIRGSFPDLKLELISCDDQMSALRLLVKVTR